MKKLSGFFSHRFVWVQPKILKEKIMLEFFIPYAQPQQLLEFGKNRSQGMEVYFDLDRHE